MNILIVGNGFDLAHGLPTRYSDYVHQISEELDFKQYLGERYEIDEESYQLFIRVKKSTLFRYIEHRCEDEVNTNEDNSENCIVCNERCPPYELSDLWNGKFRRC